MEYNKLGNSGLRVSELSFGSWLTFGSNLDVASARTCMRQAFESGVNFFDNAEVYGHGKSEIVMGEALKDFRREDLVISTKIFWGGEGPNDTGLSRKHLIEGTKNALKRLQLDYVDLLFCHRPDPSTPVEETVRAMDYLVRSGFAFYWGTSEWPAERLVEAYEIARAINCIPPTMEQPQYNMLVRERFEVEYAPLYKKYGLGTTIWSPLASGILTGKYNDKIPPGSRLAEQEWLREHLTPATLAIVKNLGALARDLGCTTAQLAIAWCLKNPNVSTVILGATNTNQLNENLGALAVKPKLTPELMKSIDKILG
jgi:voltage-dependent potassium channel beta subunit